MEKTTPIPHSILLEMATCFRYYVHNKRPRKPPLLHPHIPNISPIQKSYQTFFPLLFLLLLLKRLCPDPFPASILPLLDFSFTFLAVLSRHCLDILSIMCFCFFAFFAGILPASLPGVSVAVVGFISTSPPPSEASSWALEEAVLAAFPENKLESRSKEFNWPLDMHCWSFACTIAILAFAAWSPIVFRNSVRFLRLLFERIDFAMVSGSAWRFNIIIWTLLRSVSGEVIAAAVYDRWDAVFFFI